ncbi:MAG: hypothetical protein IPI35_30230 [Deltaproteobacteria bacterium]|nr:hypothetical protein [Deltaproteobacteria bacterium]
MERVAALRGVEMGPVTAPAAPAMRSHEVTWYEGAGETLTAEPHVDPGVAPSPAPSVARTAGATLAPSLTMQLDVPAEAPAAPAAPAAPTDREHQNTHRAMWALIAVCLLAIVGLGAALYSGVSPFAGPAGEADAAEGGAAVLTADVPRRPLELVVTGLPTGTPFGARLDGQAPDAQDGFVLRFAGVTATHHWASS